MIEKHNLNKYDEGIGKDKRFFLAHSYGLPYLSGIGAYYFNKKSLYFTEINTSFSFSNASVGYNYELLNNFYAGSNTGIIYLPSEETTYISHFSMRPPRALVDSVLSRYRYLRLYGAGLR